MTTATNNFHLNMLRDELKSYNGQIAYATTQAQAATAAGEMWAAKEYLGVIAACKAYIPSLVERIGFLENN